MRRAVNGDSSPGLVARALGRLRNAIIPGGVRDARGSASSGARLAIEYSPSLDGDADPGEVVWTWVAYEENPARGKDRPVIVIGRRGTRLVAIALTSKRREGERQVPVGSGPWDRDGRPSYAKVERLLDVDAAAVRREGAILDRRHFDAVVTAARLAHGGELR